MNMTKVCFSFLFGRGKRIDGTKVTIGGSNAQHNKQSSRSHSFETYRRLPNEAPEAIWIHAWQVHNKLCPNASSPQRSPP